MTHALQGRKQSKEHIAKRVASNKRKPRKLVDIEYKLLKKILKREDGCWEWLGAVFKKAHGNYGQIRMGRKGEDKVRFSHRVSYEHYIGEVPRGLELDHLCRNTLCVNPQHLEPVTHYENMRRGYWVMKDRCVHGHLYSEDNTYINIRGHRECKICRKLRVQKSNAKTT